MSNQLATGLPVGWSSATLGQVSECILGGTPSTEVRQFWGGDVPWMASGDVHLRRVTDVPGRITALGLRSSNATLTSPPAVAVGLAGQGKTRGTVALTLCTLSTNQSIALLKTNGSDLRSDYLFHNLDRRYEELRARSSGGGRGGLSKAILEAVPIELPPLSEQQKVAQILDTLDTTIHETEAIIAKLKAVKQGLLHDLLTRGIAANGELRPPRSEAPHLYKESPLGWIPLEWEVVPLGELSESLVDGPFGSNLKTAHYVENPGVRVVRLQNIFAGQYDDSERAFISERHAASLVRNRVTAGDALIASLGEASYPVGRSCCYPADLPDAINKADCFRFRSGPRCRNTFVMHSMNGPAARKQVRGYEQGVTMKRINLGNLRRIEIALPSIPEQDAIVERLEGTQQQIDATSLQLKKLQNEKLGLMDDLLTGRVRVTPLLAQQGSD